MTQKIMVIEDSTNPNTGFAGTVALTPDVKTIVVTMSVPDAHQILHCLATQNTIDEEVLGKLASATDESVGYEIEDVSNVDLETEDPEEERAFTMRVITARSWLAERLIQALVDLDRKTDGAVREALGAKDE